MIMLALVIIIGITAFSRRNLQKGINEIEINDDWNKVMAKSINQSEIKLNVDGKEIDLGDRQLYMSDNMELMIPTDIVIETFDCSQNIYGDDRIVIEKGSSKATLRIGKSKIKFNDNDYKLNEKVIKKDDVIYLPASLFSQHLGYEYIWNSDTNTGSLKNESTGGFLPERYSYVEEKRDVKAKDQGNYGTCWAFATLTALETSLMPEESFDFSENNLVHNNELSDKIQDGGDYIMSMAYLMAWKGPVLEEDDPYGNNGGNISEMSLQPVKHVQGAEIIPSKDYEQIKEKVFKYGGVESSMYMSMDNSSSSSVYYNDTECAYCYKGNNEPNHDVVIIGWDDNYSKELFNDDTIKKDGAFICRNSWGSDFGFDGVFYISYEDDCIGTNNVCYTDIENVDNYDNIYQSDLCGWTGTMGFKGKTSAYFANVYTAKKTEMLQAVGFYSTTADLSYEVFVCENYEDKNSLNDRNHVAASGTIDNKGYYTIKLDENYEIEEGSKFAVIVKISNNEDGNVFKLIPVEMDNDSVVGTVDLTDGEGYFSSGGYNWQSAEQQDCNICLKAYTSNKE